MFKVALRYAKIALEELTKELKEYLEFYKEREKFLKEKEEFLFSLKTIVKQKTELERIRMYSCGHCGYIDPCYGNELSTIWCKCCQRNDRLSNY